MYVVFSRLYIKKINKKSFVLERFQTNPKTHFFLKIQKTNFDIIMLILLKRDFFSKNGSATFLPLTSCEKARKSLEPFSNFLLTTK